MPANQWEGLEKERWPVSYSPYKSDAERAAHNHKLFEEIEREKMHAQLLAEKR